MSGIIFGHKSKGNVEIGSMGCSLRKNKFLYIKDGDEDIEVLAYFRDETSANKFEIILNKITEILQEIKLNS